MICPFKPTDKNLGDLFDFLLPKKGILSDETHHVWNYNNLIWLWCSDNGYSKDPDIFDFLQNENLLSEYFKSK